MYTFPAVDETKSGDCRRLLWNFEGKEYIFVCRVYDDDQEWFRKIFASSTKEDAIRNQYEFFVQRMGGPQLYSQRKGDHNL